MRETKKEALHCANCRHPLDLGVDAIHLERGVVGPRGFVPLGEIILFCGEECLRGYFTDNNKDTEYLPRRIP